MTGGLRFPTMHAGRIIVYVFAVCCAAALAVSLWLGFTGRDEARENQSILGLRQIHEKAQRWAREHDGAYPDHISQLLTWTSLSPIDFTDPREPQDSVWMIEGVDLRSLPLTSNDPDRAAAARDQLNAALASIGDRSWYRFGDFYFARLDQPTNDPRIVFGWTIRGEGGRRFIMFDDGRGRRIERAEWEIVWEADSAARSAKGLPTIDLPPFDG